MNASATDLASEKSKFGEMSPLRLPVLKTFPYICALQQQACCAQSYAHISEMKH